MRALGARSVMAVPLVAPGRALGAITLAIGLEAGATSAADVALAQELARRAAIAIDNARLYQEAQEAIRLRDEFLTVASHELNTPIASLAPQRRALRWATSPAARRGHPQDAGHRRIARPSGCRAWSARSSTCPGSRRARFQLRLEPVDLGALVRDGDRAPEGVAGAGRAAR